MNHLHPLKTLLFGIPAALALLAPASLSAPTPDRVRFVAFGDMGTGADIQYRVAKAVAEKCQKSGCDFAVTVGDNIYNNGVTSISDPQFQSKFEKPYANLPFRFYMTLGNHDYRGNVQAQVLYTQHSKKWYMPSRYYRFEAGPVSFFALDTNQPDATQRNTLQSWLKDSKSPWKIAFGHHPRYTNSYYKDTQSPALKQLLDTLCNQGQLYLAGHEHDKQHLKARCGVEHLIVGTGGGNRPVLGKGPDTLFAAKTFGFAWIEATPQQLRFEVLDTQGNVEYSYTLNKP